MDGQIHHIRVLVSVGGGDLVIFSSTLMGFRVWCGGSISAASISVMPRDQISDLHEYAFSFDVSHMITSGAILEHTFILFIINCYTHMTK